MILEINMCDADREKFGGPEWVQLDLDRLMETPAEDLIRWEAEARGYPIGQAIADAFRTRVPTAGALMLLWLARKQGGDLAGGIVEETGRPEPYSRLSKVRALQMQIRITQDDPEPAEDADAVPPESTPAP